jgi:pimeloyl-ACP methyl ester carboxylesterase
MSSRDEQPTEPARLAQAVVLIHGIGEQRPMATLRGFVSALLDQERDCPGDRYYSKPDTISDSYELRRIKLRRADAPDGINCDWPRTDFYEYYWAHQMFGTTASHVLRWLPSILKRSWSFIGPANTEFPRLRWLALLVWGAIAILAGISAVVPWRELIRFAFGSPLPAVAILAFGYLLLRLVLGTVLDVVGDAARYFDIHPKNVARRYDILRGGIALLRRLHEEGDVQGDRSMYRYGRIVLVGHSLGSVIAYDILRHYWGEVNGRIPVNPESGALKSVEAFEAPPSIPAATTSTTSYWKAQYALWKAIGDRVPAGVELSRDELWRLRTSPGPYPGAAAATEPLDHKPKGHWRPGRWLVSDLVTMGSPLSHAVALLATDKKDLDAKRRLRELPTCPPDRSRHVNPESYSVDLRGEASGFDNYDILHHGACFASTRWTNLWYANDPIGGPLLEAFGNGIRDIRLCHAPLWPMTSHTSYWRPLAPTPERPPTATRILETILRDVEWREDVPEG